MDLIIRWRTLGIALFICTMVLYVPFVIACTRAYIGVSDIIRFDWWGIYIYAVIFMTLVTIGLILLGISGWMIIGGGKDGKK